jgi:hypothetical protein
MKDFHLSFVLNMKGIIGDDLRLNPFFMNVKSINSILKLDLYFSEDLNRVPSMIIIQILYYFNLKFQKYHHLIPDLELFSINHHQDSTSFYSLKFNLHYHSRNKNLAQEIRLLSSYQD